MANRLMMHDSESLQVLKKRIVALLRAFQGGASGMTFNFQIPEMGT